MCHRTFGCKLWTEVVIFIWITSLISVCWFLAIVTTVQGVAKLTTNIGREFSMCISFLFVSQLAFLGVCTSKRWLMIPWLVAMSGIFIVALKFVVENPDLYPHSIIWGATLPVMVYCLARSCYFYLTLSSKFERYKTEGLWKNIINVL